MTTTPSLRDAAKMALDALQDPLGFTGSRQIDAILNKAIKDLRVALAAPEAAPVERQPLTKDEIFQAYMDGPLDLDLHAYQLEALARGIEAAHNIQGAA